MKKRVAVAWILMMCMALMVGLGGCGGKSQADGQQSAAGGSTANGTADASEQGKEVTMNLWVNRTSDRQAKSETFDRIIADIRAVTGVRIVPQYYDWGDSYRQKMNMYAASKDLPSGVWQFAEPIKNSFNLSILNKMGEEGMFWPLDKYVDDTQNYTTLKENASEVFISMTRNKTDGNLYLYPCNIHREFPHAPGGITIRKDWLDQTGLGYPESVDEFYQLIRKFKETYRDDAGKPCIPVSLCGFDDPVQEYVLRFWLNTWLGTGVWYEHDGRYDYAKYNKTAELKQALLFLNKLWREDLFDKEAFAQKPEQFVEKCVNGKIGIHSYSYDTTYKASDTLMKEDPKETKYFVAMPPFSATEGLPTDKVNACEIITVPLNCFVVTREGISEDQLTQYMKCIDYIGTYDANFTYTLGYEGEQWEKDADGRIKYTGQFIENRDKIPNYGDSLGTGLVSCLNTNAKVMSVMLSMVVTQKDRLESCANIKGHQIAIADAVNTIVPGKVELEKQPLIEKAWLQMVIKAVSAKTQEECAARVDEWPGQLKALGYEQWAEERTQIAREALGRQ